MLTEGLLGVLVIIAVAAGIGMYAKGDNGEALKGLAAWNHHYSSWEVAQGLTSKVTAFVNGAANMLTTLGIPRVYGQAIIGVLVASFAGTTLDTATRIQRYVVTEFAVEHKIKPLTNRYSATAFVVLAAGLLAFSQGGGQGALLLWPLFGTSNQLLAGLVLLVALVYVMKELKTNPWPILIPMIFMIISSSWAMVVSVIHFLKTGSELRFIIGSVLLFFEAWMIVEAIICIKRLRVNSFNR